LEFIPGTFIKDQFGELIIERKYKSWLDSSLILTKEEVMILDQMTHSKDGILLYRATTDGFEASAFHAKCDDKENTITIIKTNGYYVFGGYTAAKWSSNFAEHIEDSKAFIFSLRRKGISCNYKFNVRYAKYAIYVHPRRGPSFGINDLIIRNNSNTHGGGSSKLGQYDFHPDNGEPRSFLAGSSGFSTTEIEVYQINK
jgi:hypothetical protein